ncbi:hypothetical protein SAEN111111_14825 [Saccharibacillus endophyticus]
MRHVQTSSGALIKKLSPHRESVQETAFFKFANRRRVGEADGLRAKPFSCRSGYPLIDPTYTPFTKYFCKNGYTSRIGSVETTMVQYLTSSR